MTDGGRTVSEPDATWDAFVEAHPQGAIYHTSAWARVLREAYGYQTVVHTLRDEQGRITAGLTVALTRHGYVGLPLADFAEPLGEGQEVARLVRQLLDRDAGAAGCALLFHCRGEQPYLDGMGFSERRTHVRHVVPLKAGLRETLDACSHDTRRGIRTAQRRGVRVTDTADTEALRAFYGLYCQTRRHHGLPPQPYEFFEALQRAFLAKNAFWLTVAYWGDLAVSAGLAVSYRDTLYGLYSGSLRKAHTLRPNHLVMYRELARAHEAGLRYYDLGRTLIGQEGLQRFKRSWGASVSALVSYAHGHVLGSGCMGQGGLIYTAARRILRRLPMPILSQLGRMVYRRVG